MKIDICDRQFENSNPTNFSLRKIREIFRLCVYIVMRKLWKIQVIFSMLVCFVTFLSLYLIISYVVLIRNNDLTPGEVIAFQVFQKKLNFTSQNKYNLIS